MIQGMTRRSVTLTRSAFLRRFLLCLVSLFLFSSSYLRFFLATANKLVPKNFSLKIKPWLKVWPPDADHLIKWNGGSRDENEPRPCRFCELYSRPQRPLSFAPWIATPGLVQHMKSAIHGLSPNHLAKLIGWEYETNTLRMLRRSGQAKGRDSWCWPNRAKMDFVST